MKIGPINTYLEFLLLVLVLDYSVQNKHRVYCFYYSTKLLSAQHMDQQLSRIRFPKSVNMSICEINLNKYYDSNYITTLCKIIRGAPQVILQYKFRITF